MKHFTTVLILVVISISTVLLIGLRFDAQWAGGSGTQSHQKAWLFDKPGPEIFERGEIISTMPDSELTNFKIPLQLSFGEAMIYLDKNTEVKIIDGREGQLTINVIQGRVVVDGALTIATREMRTKIDGCASFVHYSWLNEAEIAPMSGTVRLNRDERIETLTDRAIKTSTLEPYDDETIEFNPKSSSAAEFYEQIAL